LPVPWDPISRRGSALINAPSTTASMLCKPTIPKSASNDDPAVMRVFLASVDCFVMPCSFWLIERGAGQ
jgi:hypothetical protein